MNIKSPAIIKSDGKIIPVGLYDVIELKKTNERKIRINKVSGYKIPTNNTNPVYRVAEDLMRKKPNKIGIDIDIQKNIPTSSGLNSQFSNAAGVLIALNELWGVNLGKNELLKIARKTDPIVAKILRLYFNPKKIGKKNVILIRPKYIKTDENWFNNAISRCRRKSWQNTYQSVLCKYFPDIKQIIAELKRQNPTKVGISGKGPIIFGYSEKAINVKKIKKSLDNKIDFIWSGSTCNPYGKLLE